jgi:hypothetical protein
MIFGEVSFTKFYQVIGPQNVHPRILGKFPYRSDFVTPSGELRGYKDTDGKYFLPNGVSAK